MKNYNYIARDSAGARRHGLTQALTANDVLGWLREQDLTPVSVTELEPARAKAAAPSRRKRVKSADLAAVCWQLTTMLEGGIPITGAMESIADEIDNVTLRDACRRIVQDVRKGESLSDSAAKHPRVFNRLACCMLLAGETGGALPTTLRKLAEYYDERDKLAKKVKGAMAYPVFVLSFILLIVIFIMTFIIPRFRVIFSQIGSDLPAFTKAFMAFYDGVKANVIYIIGSAFLMVVFSILFGKTEPGRRFFSRLVLRIPLIGKIIAQAFVAMFCRTMATLIGAGVSVIDNFDILSDMTHNHVIRTAIVRAREHILTGSNVSLGLAAAGFFPSMVVKMIQVGEESGSLVQVLERTADYYERKVNATITTVMGLLEPLMIVSVGGIVLVVVLALYLPIFSISNVAK